MFLKMHKFSVQIWLRDLSNSGQIEQNWTHLNTYNKHTHVPKIKTWVAKSEMGYKIIIFLIQPPLWKSGR